MFCLKDGPWTVKLFDFLSRVSGRVIITTTSLMFLTMCHSTFNSLSRVVCLRRLMSNIREDNKRLHIWGGKLMGVCVLVHVWSLLLPSIFSGFANVVVTVNSFSLPANIALGANQIDADAKEARWGVDDLWRLTWMTLMFGFLFPLSRYARMLSINYSLCMWIHVVIGVGFFFDSFRRRTHPHVWWWNTPFFLWYVTGGNIAL